MRSRKGVSAMDAELQGAGAESGAESAGWSARGGPPAAARVAAPARSIAGVHARKSSFLARVLGVLGAIGLFISVALVAPIESAHVLAGPGGVVTAIGRVSAMAGTYLLLVTLLLIARIPAVEAAIGQDRLVALHRRLGPLVLGLIGLHVVTVVVGYAMQVSAGPLHELVLMVMTFPGMLMAAAGLGLLVMAGVTSYRYVRRKMKYETWWAVHLYTYLAVALSVPHQILTGAPFIGHPLAAAWWLTLWFATAGAVLVYRWGLPLTRSLRHGVRVTAVEEEAPGVVSVTMRGRHARPARGQGRPVPALAVPQARPLVAGAPVLALGGAHDQRDAHHRQGPGRPQQLAVADRAGHARGHRRSLRGLHPPRAAHRPRPARGGGRRRDAREGDARRPAPPRRRGRHPARRKPPRPRPARRDRAGGGRARRAPA